MDTTNLVVGQDVFMRSGQVGNWAKVVKVTSTGVIVESDPVYGSELIRFDENGTACDSSDLRNDNGVRRGPTNPIMGSGPWKLYLNTKEAGFAKIMDTTKPEDAVMNKASAMRMMRAKVRKHKDS